MVWNTDDTIAASAAAPGTAVRGILRISGPGTASALAHVFQAHDGNSAWLESKLPRRFPGCVQTSSILAKIPAALCFWPGRRSFTGEMLAELHLPGNHALLEAVLEELFQHNVRIARRGEFTLRAFLHGRIDLLQAEAVLGVIEAADHLELQQALDQLGGSITGRLRQLREDLTALLGDLEAGLDFVDEDIEFISRSEVTRRIQLAAQLIATLLHDSAAKVVPGYRRRIVLAGLPNAGKSTLFNALAGHDQAIVSPIPGTTRDYLSAPLLLENIPVDLIDTAGWEEARETIGSQAQRFREEQIQAADLVIWCSAADLSTAATSADRQLQQLLIPQGTRQLRIQTRADLAPPQQQALHLPELHVSAALGTGLSELRKTAARLLTTGSHARSELLAVSSVRCRNSLERAHACLNHALDAAQLQLGDELLSLELRAALRELQEVLGEVCTDDVLDHIFSRFCIGK